MLTSAGKLTNLAARTLLPIVVLFLISPSTARADKVDDYVRQAMQKRRIPGLALAVVKDGKVVKAKGYGVANLETQTPVTPVTVFELASITKQFTATGIMLLVEQGKVDLDQKISRYLEGTPESWKQITVRHLLTHTSGLPPLEKGFGSLVWTLNISTAEMYDAARKDPLGFAAGDKWEYSDVGYFLLGMIIENVSGQAYAEFLAERIFKPAGMTNSSVMNQYEVIKNRARGYTIAPSDNTVPSAFQNEVVNIRRDTYVELPSHYGIMSTALDLAKWDAALSSERILKQSSLNLMWTPVRLNDGDTHPYGFGWGLDERRGHKIVGHGGMTGTEIERFINDRLTIIVLTNLGSWGVATPEVDSWGITKKVAEFYLPGLAYHPIPDRDPELTAVVKSLFSQPIVAGWDQKLFTPELWANLQGLSSKQEDFRLLGPLRSIELVEQRKEGAEQDFRYRLTYDRASLLLLVTRNDDGKFAGIHIRTE
jgi:CubicO group peptidase (beta-lactamase class C family)